MADNLKQAFTNLIVSGGLHVPMARRPNRARGDIAFLILAIVVVIVLVAMR